MNDSNIVVIHTDFAFRTAVADILTAAGYRVLSATTSETGVAMVQSNHCSVAILGTCCGDTEATLDAIEAASPQTRCLVLGSEGVSDGRVRYLTGRVVDSSAFLDLVEAAHGAFDESHLLRDGAHRYRTLYAAIPDATCIVDTDTRVVIDANDVFFTLYRRGRTELGSLRYDDLWLTPTRDAPRLFCTCLQSEQARTATAYQTMHRRSDGSEFPVSITTRRFVSADRSLVCMVIRDISDLEEARTALSITNARLNAIIEGLGDSFIAIGSSLAVIHANHAAVQTFGGEGGHIGSRLYEGFPRLDRTDIDQWIREVLIEPRTVSFETEIETTNGNEWFEVKLSPFDGNLSIFFQRITAKKEMELRLRQTQRLEAVGRLAGGVAHDFNNLLTVVLGYADMIRDTADLTSDVAEGIDEIKSAAERATGLTQQLLAFSRKQMLKPEVIDPNDLIRSIEKMIRRLIGEDLHLEMKLAEAGLIKVDPLQLEQVLLNLAINARDAMCPGGSLTIETTHVEITDGGSDPDRTMRDGKYVLLSVSDTGCGMDGETIEHIFEPFFSTKSRDRGTGLGLSTTYGIIKQSGGYVFADSTVGVGTEFQVYLPASTPLPETHASQTEEPPRETRSGRILIVEDEDALRSIAVRLLESFGYTVIDAANAEDALRILGIDDTLDEEATDANSTGTSDEQVDLVITDVVMPGLSGRDLVNRIRERQRKVKVLYMSGYTDDEMVSRGISNRGEAFLAKPFSSGLLDRTVKEILEG